MVPVSPAVPYTHKMHATTCQYVLICFLILLPPQSSLNYKHLIMPKNSDPAAHTFTEYKVIQKKFQCFFLTAKPPQRAQFLLYLSFLWSLCLRIQREGWASFLTDTHAFDPCIFDSQEHCFHLFFSFSHICFLFLLAWVYKHADNTPILDSHQILLPPETISSPLYLSLLKNESINKLYLWPFFNTLPHSFFLNICLFTTLKKQIYREKKSQKGDV